MKQLASLLLVVLVTSPAIAGSANSIVYTAVPALDDVGLAAITLVVAIAGGIAARRRNKK